MSPYVMTVVDDMTTDDLARYLVEHEISGAPVVDEQGHLVGVVSMTDIGRNVADPAETELDRGTDFYRDDATDLPFAGHVGRGAGDGGVAMVRDIMTAGVCHVPVGASVGEVARLMVEQHMHRVVVTEDKQPVGIITSMDLLRLLAGQS
ncbi:MAG: CBS domain-containing protein [Vicinamibacterales bacterium]